MYKINVIIKGYVNINIVNNETVILTVAYLDII